MNDWAGLVTPAHEIKELNTESKRAKKLEYLSGAVQELRAEAEADGSDPFKWALYAYLCVDLAQVLDEAERSKEAFEVLVGAVNAAHTSRVPRVLYRTFAAMGNMLYFFGAFERALQVYQQALPYAAFSLPGDLETALHWITSCYEKLPVNPDVAIAFHDLQMSFKPTPFGVLQMKYAFMVKAGMDAEVRAAAKRVKDPTPLQIGQRVRALEALRKYDLAASAAAEGLQRAIELEDTSWQVNFQSYLNHDISRPRRRRVKSDGQQ